MANHRKRWDAKPEAALGAAEDAKEEADAKVEIEDEDDMIVMNCGEILIAFFATLEDKAA